MNDDNAPSDPMQYAENNSKSMIDRSSQPDIINLKQLQTSTAQEVESDILRPVVFSQDFIRYELEPKGFLSPTSSITLGLEAVETIKRAQHPINVGVASLIDRAVLKTSSGRVICDMEDFGGFHGLKTSFIDPSVLVEKEQYLSGRCMSLGPLYTDASATSTKFSQFTEVDKVGLQNGKEYGGHNGVGATVGLTPRIATCVSSDALRSGLNPTFSVKLYDLFPFLKSGNQIPLFMLGSDRVQIEIYFTKLTSKNRMSLSKEDEGSTGHQFKIDQNLCEFVSDHIFYPGQMEKWAEMNKDLTFQYYDYVLSRQNITSASDNSDNSKVNVRQIGGAGRIVTRVYANYEPTGNDADDRGILNKYQAVGMKKDGEGTGKLESNLFYNERFLFPINVTNNARHYHNLRDAEMKQVFIPDELYCGQDMLLPNTTDGESKKYDGRGQDSLRASQFYQGFRLNRGERVGTKGIELTMNATTQAGDDEGLKNASYIQKVYTEQLRYATLKDGQLEVFWS